MALPVIGAQAQNYPSRPATVIVPFAPGGPADITGRIVADIFSRHLGQQFVVENVGGAGGTTGTTARRARRPDGYTLGLGHMGTHAAAPALYPNLAYNPENDFEPVGLIAEQPELLAVRKDFPANNLEGVRRLCQSQRKQAQHGACRRRLGVLYRLPAAQHAIGIKPTMVPFTGTAPAMNAMLAGQVDYDCDPMLGPLPHVRAGTVKALAIAHQEAQPAAARRADLRRAGMPEFDCAPFYAVFAPKGTPKPIVDKLAEALSKGLDEAAVRKRLESLGADIAEPNRRGPKALADR